MDNLSIRELHETFKATFGRETSLIKYIALVKAINQRKKELIKKCKRDLLLIPFMT